VKNVSIANGVNGTNGLHVRIVRIPKKEPEDMNKKLLSLAANHVLETTKKPILAEDVLFHANGLLGTNGLSATNVAKKSKDPVPRSLLKMAEKHALAKLSKQIHVTNVLVNGPLGLSILHVSNVAKN
jgi:inosine/xanthosine triphosphate pyrophosphatase family protein